MEFEQLIKIIETVSNSSLTSFHYEAANGEKIDIDRPAGAAPAAAQGAAVTGGTASEAALAGTAAPAAAAVVPAAGTVGAAAPAEAAAGVLPAGAAAETVAAGTTSAAETASADSLKEGNMVTSPLVGTFYAAPAEDAEPFVKVGDHVKKGQTLGIVEAMKLMNEIESDYDGVVTAILVQNGDTVEYGMPLFCIA